MMRCIGVKMTYKQLKIILDAMEEQELNQTATIFVPGIDEYFPATVAYATDEQDVLDVNHPILTLE